MENLASVNAKRQLCGAAFDLSWTTIELRPCDFDCLNLRRDASRHDAVIQNMHTVMSGKTAGAVCFDKNFLPVSAAYKQAIRVDFQNFSTKSFHNITPCSICGEAVIVCVPYRNHRRSLHGISI